MAGEVGGEGHDGPCKITWADYEYNSDKVNVGSPSGLEGGWTSNTAREEESLVTPRALFLEIIATIEENVVVIVRIQLWRVLTPFFPVRVRVVTSFYTEIHINDRSKSFFWCTNFPRIHVNGHPDNHFYSRQHLFANLHRLQATKKGSATKT